MAHDVFISYSARDKVVADAVCATLESRKMRCWIAPRDVLPGESWVGVLIDAIGQSRVFVLVFSDGANESSQVLREVGEAVDKGIPIIPFRIEDVPPSKEMGYYIKAIHWLDALTPPLEKHLQKLGDRVQALLVAEAPAREQEQRLEAILRRANQATEAGDWDRATAALNEYLALVPGDAAIQRELLEIQQRQRESRLKALRDRAGSLTQAEEWNEALSALREYLALGPEDREAAQAELQQVEKLQRMARTYAEGKAALVRKDYERAIRLLRELVVDQDEAYKDAASLLAKAIKLRGVGRRSPLPKWLWGGLAAVALVALVLLMVRILSSAIFPGLPLTPSPTTLSLSSTPFGPTLTGIAMVPAGKATLTHPPEPISRTITPSRSPLPINTATPRQTLLAPSASPAVTGTGQLIFVPDALVGEFFSPGPSPVALAVAGDTLWVIDGKQRVLYQLDRFGMPLASFPITFTTSVLSMAWDGAALRLVLSDPPHNPLIVHLNAMGTVLDSFTQRLPWKGDQTWSGADGTMWEYRDEFLLKFSADGELLQTFHAPIWGGLEALAWAPDGLWVIGIFGDWYRFGFDGSLLRSGKLSVGTFPYYPTLTFDEQGYLWLLFQGDRKIYQLSLHQVEVQLQPTPLPKPGTELALPRPQLRSATAEDKSIAHITNNLQGPMTLSFGDESTILAPGTVWSKELEPGVYTVYASANIPGPIAFAGKELLVAGYEYSWVLERPN
ncbi:MAG: TIR domain-containing protein [Chloroflexi bacterium]|nr:TIR domain-containing protein [Chloroflexota bacterium]